MIFSSIFYMKKKRILELCVLKVIWIILHWWRNKYTCIENSNVCNI